MMMCTFSVKHSCSHPCQPHLRLPQSSWLMGVWRGNRSTGLMMMCTFSVKHSCSHPCQPHLRSPQCA